MTISQVKKHREAVTSSSIPMDDTSVIGGKEPEAILDHMIVKQATKLLPRS